ICPRGVRGWLLHKIVPRGSPPLSRKVALTTLFVPHLCCGSLLDLPGLQVRSAPVAAATDHPWLGEAGCVVQSAPPPHIGSIAVPSADLPRLQEMLGAGFAEFVDSRVGGAGAANLIGRRF